MFKKELEERIGYELTERGWKELEKMYMSCDLSKDVFAQIVKNGAKIFKVETKKDTIYKGVKIEWVESIGMWKINNTRVSMCRGTYFDHLEQAKQSIKLVLEK